MTRQLTGSFLPRYVVPLGLLLPLTLQPLRLPLSSFQGSLARVAVNTRHWLPRSSLEVLCKFSVPLVLIGASAHRPGLHDTVLRSNQDLIRPQPHAQANAATVSVAQLAKFAGRCPPRHVHDRFPELRCGPGRLASSDLLHRCPALCAQLVACD